MQSSTTRIVSCNMTSFLVLNHERVRCCNGTLKPNNNPWCDHLDNDNINHLQDASTLRLQKLYDSLAKEPISTHAKRATWMLAQKADLQSIVKHICKHLSENCQRSYFNFLIYYELPFDGILDSWKNKPVSFQWKAWITHHGQAFPVLKIHNRFHHLKGCKVVYTGGNEATASIYLSIAFIYNTKQNKTVWFLVSFGK